MPEEAAFRELVRVLEEAVQAGVNTIGLEYKDRELMVFHYVGNMGLGATRIAQDLRRPAPLRQRHAAD